MTPLNAIVTYLNALAPARLAASWDNTGLLLGRRDQVVHKILTCLTVTPEVVAEAVDGQVNLIVSHHPVLFKAVKNLSEDSPDGRLLGPLLRADIAVYSPHTRFDNCIGGINDQLAALFGLSDVQPLRSLVGPAVYKLVVFVPKPDVAKVLDAMFAAGAGWVGDGRYSECSFRTPGTGTFKGEIGANPTIGQVGMREEVAEDRIEVLVPVGKLHGVVEAMKQAHCYEVVAYDVYPLVPWNDGGEGRQGKLKQTTTLDEFAKLAGASTNAQTLQIVGDPSKPVQKVALACGAAGEFLDDAIRSGADTFVTGELRFHEALKAEAAGIGVVLLGHYASERPAVEWLAGSIQQQWPDVVCRASTQEHDPLRTVRIRS
jgi:dinuclear metal center YbgI/SA1388 family protein